MQTNSPLNLTTHIRPARASDLGKLEWFGKLTPFRASIEQAFARQEQGELAFLVAVVNGYPIGQVLCDVVKLANQSIGEINALRVLDPFQRCGIASKLLLSAENTFRQHNLTISQLGVAKENTPALALYKKMQYQIIAETIEPYHYTTADGIEHSVDENLWVMEKKLGAE